MNDPQRRLEDDRIGYWKSLSEEVRAPQTESVRRRDILKYLASSMALVGLYGCAPKRAEKIVPYVISPKGLTPTVSEYYATSMELDGFATGLLVRMNDGRPTKIDGNPAHPASLGAAGVLEQASVLDLYDPSRARMCRSRRAPSTLEQCTASFANARADRGSKLRLLLAPTSSPLVEDLLGRIVRRFPGARFTFDTPFSTSEVEQGGQLAFGVATQPVYDLTRARTLVSIESDFLAEGPGALRYARDFASLRRTANPGDPMNRLYAIESSPSSTGSMADHRIAIPPRQIASLVIALVQELARLLPGRVPAPLRDLLTAGAGDPGPLVRTIARDLARAPESSVLIAGQQLPRAIHALTQLANRFILQSEAFAAVSPTLIGRSSPAQSMADLARDLDRGDVDTLLILGSNPVYTAPVDLDFASKLSRVPNSIQLGRYLDETTAHTTWFIPETHYLESWGDCRAFDGTASLVQPLIEPLFQGHSLVEILALVAGERTPVPRRLLEQAWKLRHSDADFARFWDAALAGGVIPNSAAPYLQLSLHLAGISQALESLRAAPPPR